MRVIALLCVLLLTALSCSVDVTEARGLSVVAKDPATNQVAEVQLYNKSYAVIIGIDKYVNLPPDRQLSYAVNDAKGIESVLKNNYRFDKIITLYNEQATKDNIIGLFTEKLPAEMGKDDSLFIFWAGHGNQEKSDYGDLAYLLPYNGSTDKIYQNITASEIRDYISKKIPAKHIFYVFDTCFSGLFYTTRAVDGKSRRDLSYLKEITKEPVRQILIAGSKGQEVLVGGPRGYSVFAGRLIEILEADGDFLTANEIQAIIREKVYSDSIRMGHSQTPSFGSLSGTGDFVFIRNFDKKLPDNQIKLATVEQKSNGLQNQEKVSTVSSAPLVKKDMKPPTIALTSPTVKRGLKIVEKDEVLLVAGRALDESGVESVTVNGKVANLDGNGNFSTEIPLKVGTNQVTVLAKDTRGNIGSEKFSVTRKQGEKTVAKAPPQTSSSARSYSSANLSETGAYYALVIGNNNYRYLNKLKTAERDAVEVSRLLEGSYGFKTSLLLNASRKEIMDSMNNLRNRIGENDSLLIYYAGHGEYDRAADKAYWLPVDAQRDSDTEWIIADNITANIKRLTSRHVLIISDSCYSGSMNRSGETDLSAKGDYGEYLRKILQRKSRTLLSSGGNEPVADGGGKGHSVFAEALLRGLKEDENSSFTAQDLFNRHIRARVAGKSDQVPQYGFIRNSDDDGGDFVFIRRR